MPPHVLVDFVIVSPGHGRNVTDFWGWDAHAAQLRFPDDVSGDIGGCSARRALKPKFYQPTQTMVTTEILPFRENSHGRAGNRTRDLMISSQRLWPLDHEAGHNSKVWCRVYPEGLRQKKDAPLVCGCGCTAVVIPRTNTRTSNTRRPIGCILHRFISWETVQ